MKTAKPLLEALGSLLLLRHLRTSHVKKGSIMEGFADNFIPIILQEDDTLHLPQRPFCWDSTCPCHEDQETIATVAQQVQDGLFTPEEAADFVNGKTI